MSDDFYGAELARVHHEGFGDVARQAAERLLEELGRSGVREGLVVDLGCGTGILARVLTDAGFDVLGIDLSEDMLERAREHAPAATFRQGSLVDAELPPCVGVTAIGEPLNYAADSRAGLETIDVLARRARSALAENGVLLFDVATPGRAGPTGRSERIVDHGDWLTAARAEVDADGTQLRRDIACFTAEGSDADVFRRRDERHLLALYDEAAVAARLEAAGFEWSASPSYAPEPGPSTPPSGWVVFAARPLPSV